MRNLLIAAVALSIGLSSCSKADPPAPIYPIPTPQQIEWQKLETYAFVHFGLNTFNDLEWGFGDTPSSTFNPTDLDAEQWVRIIKDAGFKGVILTAKHHDGFCLWQTETTDYSIKNSPYKDGKGDMVRELIEACRKHGLKFGLYLSPWDRNHAEYGRPEYVNYFHTQIRELITKYCDSIELMEYWFDGANGGDGYYGGTRERRSINAKEYYDYQRAVDTILKYHPKAMIFGGTAPTIRWVGNEDGWAGETSWSPYNEDSARHYHESQYGHRDGRHWLPSESDVSIRPGWFYHPREDHSVRSLSHLVDIYYRTVGHNSNLLMNFPVALNGKIHPMDSARIMEWHEVITNDFATNLLAGAKAEASSDRGCGYKASKTTDGDWDSYWATEDGVTTGTLTISMDKPQLVNRLLIQEYIPLGQRVEKFNVEYRDGDQWKAIDTKDTMSTVGYKRILRFGTVETSALRINFTQAKGPLTINNVEAFLASAILVEPVIRRNGDGMVTIKAGDESAKIYYTTDNSTPTTSSTPYSEPFKLEGKGTIKAIVADPQSAKTSQVSTRAFDILPSRFTVKKPADDKGTAAMFDGNPNSVYYMPEGVKEVVIDLGGEYTVNGISYTPDGSRWGGGPIGKYQVWVDSKMVAQGEFSNIKHNPIRQVLEFAPTKGKSVKFVSVATADGNKRSSIAEFEVLTQQ